MAAGGVGGGEPGAKDLFGLRGGEEAAAEGKDIGRVVFAGVAGGGAVVAEGGANAGELVGGHGGADAGAVDHDPEGGLALGYGQGDLFGEIGIVGRLFGMDADVGDKIAEFKEDGFQRFLQTIAAVVGADGDGTGRVDGGADLRGGKFDDGDAAFTGQIPGGGSYNCPYSYLEMSMRGNVLGRDD